MTWKLEQVLTAVDAFVVKAGKFPTEAEALAHAENQHERPRFEREVQPVDTFVCSDCGRRHTADLDKKGQPLTPKPCDHRNAGTAPAPAPEPAAEPAAPAAPEPEAPAEPGSEPAPAPAVEAEPEPAAE